MSSTSNCYWLMRRTLARQIASNYRPSTSRSFPSIAISSRSFSSTTSPSSSSSSSTPAFPCVDANEARGEKLRLQAQQSIQRSEPTSTSCSPSSTSSSSSSNPSIAFPCVDANEARDQRLRNNQGPALDSDSNPSSTTDNGPEPAYSKVVSGYELFHHSQSFPLDYGGELPSFSLAYETWGQLNQDKSNCILLHTGLSASSHAASTKKNPQKGWWESFIGPNKPLDTNKYFIICTNVLGGCYGSTGPSSKHPHDENGEAWATRFPLLSIFDMVRAQFKLLDHLGIGKIYASLGSSMGGMQSIAAAHLEPDRVERVVSISGCARSGPASIALRYAQRSVLMSDPNWNRGFYYSPGQLPPHTGMKLARQIATITYRSGPEWEQRFGRSRRLANPNPTESNASSNSPTSASNSHSNGNVNERRKEQDPALCPDFLIETYLDHQGEQFCLKYDANSLIYISKAMDLFDMSDFALEELEERRRKNRLKRKQINDGELEKISESGPSIDSIPESSLSSQDSITTTLTSTPNLKNQRQHISTLSSPAAHAYVPSLARGLSSLKNTPTLILGVQSDILFPVEQQREMAECLRLNGNENVSYYEIDAPHGHDSFLIDVANVGGAIRGFLG